jgi:hypothetical protein
LQTILPELAVQTITPLKRLVLYFLHAKIKRENFATVRESQEERIPKKFSIIYPFLNEEGNPRKTPLFC